MSEQAPIAVEPQPPARRSPLRLVTRGFAMLTAAALVGLLVYGVVARNPNTRIDESLAHQQAAPAPPFSLAALTHGNLGPTLTARLAPALRDGQVTLRELRGTPVVLNFWASWCDPCREETPLLQRMWARQARPQGVAFVGLDMQDITGDAHDFIDQFHMDYLTIRDPSNSIARDYGVTGVPETYFIDARGRVVGHVVGVSSAAQLREGIAAARSGHVVGEHQGGAQDTA